MPATLQSIEALVPLLQFLAGTGAGVAASYLFDWLRANLPDGSVLAFLYAPRYARLTVLALTFGIGTAASVLLAWATGAPLPEALDAAVAGFLSLVAAQVTHALQSLPSEPRSLIYFVDLEEDIPDGITPSA